MKYVSYEKYKAEIEKDGWKLDPTTYRETYNPTWTRAVVFRKEGEKRMLVVNVMCKKDKKNPMEMTDVVNSMYYHDPAYGDTFGNEMIKVNFTQKFWKSVSKEF